MEKRLFRNEHDKILAGVSSGIAEYMEVDVTIIRLLFVLSTIFLMGTGILVYIVMWIVVPINNDPAARFSKFNDYFKNQNNPFQTSTPFGTRKSTTEEKGKPYQDWTSSTVKDESFESWKQTGEFKPYQKNNETGRTVAGLFLLVIGMYFLMDEFGMIPFWFQLTKLWPLVFVAIGVSFIIKSKNKSAWESWRDKNLYTQGSTENSSVNSTATTEAPFVKEEPIISEEPIVSEYPVAPDSPVSSDDAPDENPDAESNNSFKK